MCISRNLGRGLKFKLERKKKIHPSCKVERELHSSSKTFFFCYKSGIFSVRERKEKKKRKSLKGGENSVVPSHPLLNRNGFGNDIREWSTRGIQNIFSISFPPILGAPPFLSRIKNSLNLNVTADPPVGNGHLSTHFCFLSIEDTNKKKEFYLVSSQLIGQHFLFYRTPHRYTWNNVNNKKRSFFFSTCLSTWGHIEIVLSFIF